jgi:hypothetical protein
MKEIHGVADATSVRMTETNGASEVTVTDGKGIVILDIASSTFPCGLSPDRARFVAACLIASADRVAAKGVPT